jgi:hypothetical protein
VVDVKAGDWITLAGVIVSLGSAVWAVVSARRAARAQAKADHYQARAEQNAERATKAAEEAAVAQKESAGSAKRAADALEKQNQMAEEFAAAAEGVPWRIEYREGALWELWNDSDLPKFNVQIGGSGVVAHRTKGLIDRIDGRSSHEFWGNTSWTRDEPRVEVTWHRRPDSQGDPLTWSGRRPPRP